MYVRVVIPFYLLHGSKVHLINNLSRQTHQIFIMTIAMILTLQEVTLSYHNYCGLPFAILLSEIYTCSQEEFKNMVTFRLYFQYVQNPILYGTIVKVQLTFLEFTDAKAYMVPHWVF